MKSSSRSQKSEAILFTFTRTILATSMRMIYPFISTFARGLGVGFADISRALTIRSFTGVIAPFLSAIADRRGRRTGMLVGIGLVTLAASILVVWPKYVSFIISVSFALLGIIIYTSSMHAYLGDNVPYGQRGLVMALVEFSWPLSFVIGIPLVGLLIARYGWLSPFLVLAVLGMMVFLLSMRTMTDDLMPESNPGGTWDNLKQVLISKSAIMALTMSMAYCAANEVVILVFGVWLEDFYNFKIAALGAASALIGISELGGDGLVAVLVDKLGKERSILIGLICNGFSALLLPWLGQSLWGALAGLFLFFLSFEFTIVSNLPLMSEILPSARATLLGVNIAVISLGRAFGALITPVLYEYGFWANLMTALLLDIVAITALSKVKSIKVRKDS